MLYRWFVGVAAGLAGCVVLAGCAIGKPEARPSPSAPAALAGCEELADVVQPHVSALDPGQVSQGEVSPPEAAHATQLLRAGGTVCGWSNPTTKEALLIGYVRLDKKEFAAEKRKIEKESQPVTTLGSGVIQAFQAKEGTPTTVGVDMFTTSGYWVSTQSHLYADANATQPILVDILHVLP